MSLLLKNILLENKRLPNTFYNIEKISTGRTLVIPDIHACRKTLNALLMQVNLLKNDQLFFLGDYIDRGPDSLGVLDFIINLINNGYNIYPIRGNHEQKLLDFYSDYRLFKIYDPEFDESDYTQIQLEVYLTFMANLPIYYVINDWIIVHAGLNFEDGNPFTNYKSMMSIRNFTIPETDFNYKIIHGHTPVSLSVIKHNISINNPIINLDNGCFYQKDNEYGRLICLDVDSMQLYKQKNIDY